MKVYCNRLDALRAFERQVAQKLAELDIDGYALVGFTYSHPRNFSSKEIDVLLITTDGIICCLEVKGYSGLWTGSFNSEWKADGKTVPSSPLNPQQQVQDYSFLIRDIFFQEIFRGQEQTNVFVNNAIVIPDDTTIDISMAAVNHIYNKGRSISVCQISGLGNALRELIKTTYTWQGTCTTRQQLEKLGLETVAAGLVKLSPEEFQKRRVYLGAHPQGQASHAESPPAVPPSPEIETKPPLPKQQVAMRWELVAGGVLVCLLGASGVWWWRTSQTEPEATYQEQSLQSHKDLRIQPLVIGIMTDPEDYAALEDYLTEELRQALGHVVDVRIEGGESLTYQEAKNQIAQKEWDLVFAYSPMNGVTAGDNGYVWIARMFPQYPSYYQSVLFVREDSSIRSLEDIQPETVIALGQLGSASKFFMPVYDLYGKTVTLSRDHGRSQDIIDLIRSGEADVGAVAKSELEDETGFRVIQESREIPGSGVYLSPELSPEIRTIVRDALLAAPQEIQESANYGEGEALNYQEFRQITLRAESLMGCTDFDAVPVRLFCQEDDELAAIESSEGRSITGEINGWTMVSGERARLTLLSDSGEVYHVLIDISLMSQIPDCTSPGSCNKRRVEIRGVEAEEQEDGMAILTVTDPEQVNVL